MGKVSSKDVHEEQIAAREEPTENMPTKLAIIYYSTYGHIHRLALEEKAGAEEVEGVEVDLRQVAETLPDEVLAKMHAPPKASVPIITPHELVNYDAFLFGVPTRYGTAPAQIKAFLDATGGQWKEGALVGKPAGVFTSTATQNGGIETTILTMVPFFTHQGMPFIPPGYTIGNEAYTMNEVRAGSPYGAATYAGPTGGRQPTKLELNYARHQGRYMAKMAKRLTAHPAD